MAKLHRMVPGLVGVLVLACGLAGCGGGASPLASGTQAGTSNGTASQPVAASQTPLAYRTVARDINASPLAAQNVVIKDEAAWEALWADYVKSKRAIPVLPAVDFTRQMLVGVFAGDLGITCRQVAVRNVLTGAGSITVDVDDISPDDAANCVPVAAQPMHIVAIDKTDGAVDFVRSAASAVPFTMIDKSLLSGVQQARTVVVKDAAAWAALWAEHAGAGRPLPQVDFNTSMVVGVFLGFQGGGCYPTAITSVVRESGKISVLHADGAPAADQACPAIVTWPAYLATVARSDLPVEFATERVLGP